MYRQDGNASATQHPHHLSATTPSSSFSQTAFPSPLFAVDADLQTTPQQPRASHNETLRQPSPDQRASTGQPQGLMQPPSTVSPQIRRATPMQSASGQPYGRSLPSRDVTANSIADAYVQFILYCNPQFDANTDTELLRSTFNSPPKSEEKEFETYRLWELLQKLEAKEIKTWSQLALDLGVEPPDVSKGQSAQKVQQYSVRLKRWLRAMHLDSFFEYLLGRQHVYFTDLPPPDDPYPEGGRDGVMIEEDLAVRSLDPSFKPKRGRKRKSDVDHNANSEADSGTKRQRRGVYGESMSAYPASAHPDGRRGDPWAQNYDRWANRAETPQTAAAATAPSHLRWKLQDGSQDVSTPHPMTALPTSMSAHIDAALNANDGKSSTRKRRRHYPAISSAWPSSSTPGGKLKGRPSASRNVQDGPYNTFPADPANERMSASANTMTPEPAHTIDGRFTASMPPPDLRRQSEGRPGKLSLQVPQHQGNPVVRLPTPPAPRVLVNGESDDSHGRSIAQPARQRVMEEMQPDDREIPGFAFEALKRILTSDLLRADLIGRRNRLSGEEAKRLADAILQRLGIPREDTDLPKDDIARLTAASWLGLGEQLNVPLGPATGSPKKITVTRFRTDAEGYEEIVSASHDADGEDVREIFDLSWTVSMAGCTGSFTLNGLNLSQRREADTEDPHDRMLRKFMADAKALRLRDAAGDHLTRAMREVGEPNAGFLGLGHDDESAGGAGPADWKAKYQALEFSARMAYGEMGRLKEEVLQRVLDVLL
ncbi:ARS binding protein 2 [Teratosphaeria destructans]|uniref:ARS binding protein 2 n=1 Tax=Teratosphaeria destructans TaxID=418781 RepID=A0A9W7T0X4_9PEZI|nr:ARS binding protein 2 [Teratosphaeria destructans]